MDGAPAKPVYGPEDAHLDPERDLGQPGQFPFTRGIYPSMYTERLWTMRQYAGFGTAEETNLRFRHLLEAGQSGLSTAFDLPTQMGYDSDHPLAQGEVAESVSPSPPSRTWPICSAASRSTVFPPR